MSPGHPIDARSPARPARSPIMSSAAIGRRSAQRETARDAQRPARREVSRVKSPDGDTHPTPREIAQYGVK